VPAHAEARARIEPSARPEGMQGWADRADTRDMSPLDRIATVRPELPGLLRPVPVSLSRVADALVLILLGLFLHSFAYRNLTHQGDLKTYQLAASAVQSGLDPYLPENLAQLAGRRVFPFVYPPVALLPFLAVAGLPAKTVALAWIWGKIVLLGLLAWAWARWLSGGSSLLAVALVAVFGWNGSSQWDLSAGNVAIVECALVWAAFGCFIAGRRGLFAALIVVAACFKLLPATFLLLLLLSTEGSKASPRLLGTAFLALLMLTLLPTLVGPASGYQKFWLAVPDATAYADANPSALGLLSHLIGSAGVSESVAAPASLALWACYALGLVLASFGVLRDSFARQDARHWVMCAVFLYVLLLPRPMAYGFVLLTPAPLYFAPRPFDRTAGRLLLALVLAAQGLWKFTLNRSDSFLVTYAPFLLTLCVWLLVVNEHSVSRARTSADGAEDDAVAQARAS